MNYPRKDWNCLPAAYPPELWVSPQECPLFFAGELWLNPFAISRQLLASTSYFDLSGNHHLGFMSSCERQKKSPLIFLGLSKTLKKKGPSLFIG